MQSNTSKLPVYIIAAISKNYAIGENGTLPWDLPKEYIFFKNQTTKTINKNKKNAVIMGRKTWESIPEKYRPLKDRINVIISKEMTFSQHMSNKDLSDPTKEGSYPDFVFHNLNSAIYVLGESSNIESIYIVGGQNIYSEAISKSYCEKLYITHIDKIYKNADTFFPSIDGNKYMIENISEINEENEIKYRFLTYVKTNYDHPENQYLNMLQKIINEGSTRMDRTGVGIKSLFGCHMEYDLSKYFPLLTTKNTFIRGIIEELLWFLRGETDAKILQEKKVKIWDGNTSREYLDKVGLNHLDEGDCGACFLENTKILTKNGYKNIEQINTDDIVFTHEGNLKKVDMIYKREYSGKIFKLTSKFNSNEIICTENHPFLICKYNNSGYNKKMWVKANELNQNDFFMIKKNANIEKNSNLFQTPICFNNFLLDKFNLYLLGYILKKCEINKNTGSNLIDLTDLSNYQNDGLLHLKIKKIFCEKDNKIDINDSSINNILSLFISSDKYNRNKKNINIPEWFYNIDPKYLQAFINGFLFNPINNHLRDSINDDIHNQLNISYELCLSIQRIYFKLGSIAKIEKSLINKNLANLTLTDQILTDYSDNDYIYIPIEKIEEIKQNSYKPVFVYNFGVNTDNSYVVENITVHNCYGFQFRHFGAKYKDCNADYSNEGVDQVKEVIRLINEDPNSRRILINLWNPSDLKNTCLPACHCLYQFYVDNGKLSLSMYQRSADMGLGVPFNIASASLMTHLFAKITGLEVGKFIHTMGDCHIYLNHLESLKKQIERIPRPLPRMNLKKKDNVEDYTVNDFELLGYYPHETIKMDMAV